MPVWTLLVAALLIGVADSAAQTCRGGAPIGARSPLQVGVGVLATKHRQVFPAPLAYDTPAETLMGSVLGGNDSWFAGGQVGWVHYPEDGPGHSSTLAGLDGGAQFPVDRGRRVVICPAIGLSNEFGPKDMAPGWKTSTRAVRGGVSVGLVAANIGTVQIVPTFGVAVSRVNVKVEYPTREVSAYKHADSDTLGQVDLGVGLVGKRFSVVPGVSIPFASTQHPSLLGPVSLVGPMFRIALGVSLSR